MRSHCKENIFFLITGNLHERKKTNQPPSFPPHKEICSEKIYYIDEWRESNDSYAFKNKNEDQKPNRKTLELRDNSYLRPRDKLKHTDKLEGLQPCSDLSIGVRIAVLKH